MALKKTGVQLTADGAAAFNRAMADGDKAVAGFGQSATAASGKVSGFGQIVTGALRQVGAIAVNALAQATRAVVGFVGDSIKKAGDFEAGMNEFGAVTGSALKDSGKSLKDFSNLFIQLGRDLPVSTKDVQQAAIELAKGGIDPATIAAGALKTSLSLAAAGGLGLADSANILSKQLGVWVDGAASAADKSTFLTQTADLLSQAANVTTSDVSSMALGLANVGGVAKVAGLSFQETVQTLAEISPSFSSASDAGTSFKTFLQRLQPTTKPAVAAMKDLGLFTDKTGSAFYDAQGNFVGMEKATALLQAATSGLTQSQKSLAFQTIFGTDAIRTAAILSEKGAAGFADMGKQMDAAGSVASQAAARQQGLNTAWENAQGSVEALQLTVGAALIPMLTGLLNNTIAPGINTVTTFADAFFSASDKVGFLTTAITGVLPGFGSLVDWLKVQVPLAVASLTTLWTGTLLPAFQTTGTMITGTILPALIATNTWITTNVGSWGQIAVAVLAGVAAFQALSGVAAIVTGVAGAFGVLTAAITASGSVLGGIVAVLGGPVTVTIAAVALAVAGLGLAWQTNFLGIRDLLSSWWSGTGQPIFTQLQTWLATTIPVALTALAGFWSGTLQPALSAVWSFIQGNVIPVLSSLASGAMVAVGVAATTLAGFWTSTLQPALSAVWSFVQTNVIPLLSSLATGAMVALGTAATVLAGFWKDTLLPAMTGVWSFIQTSVVPLFQSLANVDIALIKLALTALAGVWEKVLQPAISGVWSFLKDNLSPILKSVADFFTGTLSPNVSSAANTLSRVLGPAISTVTGFFSTWYASIGGVSGAISTVITWLDSLAKKLSTIHLPAWMTPGSPTPWEIGLWGVSAAMQRVAGTDLPLLQSNLQRVNTSLGATAQYTKVAGTAAGSQFVAGMNLGILNGMPDLVAAMRKSTDSTIQEILGFFDQGDLTAGMNQVGADALNAFVAGVQQAAPLAASAATQVGTTITAGMSLGVLKGMPALLAAMRKSTDSGIQEILGEIDTNLQTGQTLGTFNQFGADTMNAFIAGMNQTVPQLGATLGDVHQALQLIFTPPDTSSLTSALATVKGTVLDLGTLLHGNNTIEGDTKQSWGSIVDLTHQAWEQVRLGISNAVIDARTTVDTATKAILQVTTDSFTRLRATSDMAWGQIHLGIKDQITQTQANVKLSTDEMMRGTSSTFALMQADSTRIWGQIHLNIQDQITRTQAGVNLTTSDMQKATMATWGRIGADATSGWQKVKGNIETPIGAAQATVTADSTKMQTDMAIPPSQQAQIAATYKTVTDTMVEQIRHVTDAINDLYNRWRALLDLPRPKAPSGPGTPANPGTPPSTPPVPAYNPGHSAPPGGSRGNRIQLPSLNPVVAPLGRSAQVSPPATPQQIYNRSIAQQTTSLGGPTFNLTAQYAYQSERTLMQQVKTFQLLHPST